MPESSFRRIALTSRSEMEGKEETLQRIVKVIRKIGAEVFLDASRCDVPTLTEYEKFTELKEFDLIIILGGDGTILRTVKDLKDFKIPLLAVNRGTIGFLAEIDTDEIDTVLLNVLMGKHTIEERQLLSCNVLRDGKEVLRGNALNEVVISQGAIARLIELKTFLHGEPLTTFRSDGVILATPTGSTAYNLAAGGPIVHPLLSATIITPINAHSFNQKPLVIPAEETIEVEVLQRQSKFEHIEISLTFDGQTHFSLLRGDHALITTHDERVRFLKRKRDTFYETLRRKLGWGE